MKYRDLPPAAPTDYAPRNDLRGISRPLLDCLAAVLLLVTVLASVLLALHLEQVPQ